RPVLGVAAEPRARRRGLLDELHRVGACLDELAGLREVRGEVEEQLRRRLDLVVLGVVRLRRERERRVAERLVRRARPLRTGVPRDRRERAMGGELRARGALPFLRRLDEASHIVVPLRLTLVRLAHPCAAYYGATATCVPAGAAGIFTH